MKKALLLALALAGTSPVVSAQDAQAGQKKAAMCIGCHGIPGYQASFPEVHKVPMIAGQNAKYLAAALNAYKKGERKHPTMRAISGSLTDADIADLSAFYEQQGASALKTVAATSAPQPRPEVAALLTKGACVSCHGANFSTPTDPSYPKIAGQHADYLFVALKSYKSEGHATWGRSNGVMGGIAKQFSNAELKALSRHIGSMDGDLKVIPQSKFR